MNQEETYIFQNNMDGFIGEVDANELLLKHGHTHWIHLHDIWINAGGTTQLDLVTITGHGIFVTDVKNYAAHFVHENQKCYANGRVLNKNIFIQLSRSMEKVNTMMDRLNYTGLVQGKIAFVNPDSILTLDDRASEVGMNRAEFIRWIKQTAVEENQFLQANLPVELLRNYILNDFQIDNPYPPEARSMDQDFQMKRGICCEKCHHFSLDFTPYKVICKRCGQQEVKERAVVRTLCEYGIIRYGEPLKVSECEVFFAGQVTRRYISDILRKYFTKLSTGKHAAYQNHNSIFEYVYGEVEFSFKNSKK